MDLGLELRLELGDVVEMSLEPGLQVKLRRGQGQVYRDLFTGTGLPPKVFADDAEIKNAVAAQPGAIGYISASALDGSVKKLDIK